MQRCRPELVPPHEVCEHAEVGEDVAEEGRGEQQLAAAAVRVGAGKQREENGGGHHHRPLRRLQLAHDLLGADLNLIQTVVAKNIDGKYLKTFKKYFDRMSTTCSSCGKLQL